jgi:hypothetical protein
MKTNYSQKVNKIKNKRKNKNKKKTKKKIKNCNKIPVINGKLNNNKDKNININSKIDKK